MAQTAFITIAGEILLPLALLAGLWRSTCRSRCDWLLQVLASFAFLALSAVAGPWLLLPWWLPYGYAVLGLAAATASWHRFRRTPFSSGGRFRLGLRMASSMGLTLFCTSMLIWALSGYEPPQGPSLKLESPLKGGTFYVVNGGYSILINPHLKTLQREPLSAYRAQSYALDIVRLDRFGLRAYGLWPAELGRYHIFGEPVFAPCTGVVVQTEGQLPDQIPPQTDPLHPPGNHVRLECGEAEVVLAHLMHASIAVGVGQAVQAGQPIGRVGNSGLSLEPHLHLHAQHRGPEGNFMAAEPMPISVAGRILVRNSRLSDRD
jgi:hypothetical protein